MTDKIYNNRQVPSNEHIISIFPEHAPVLKGSLYVIKVYTEEKVMSTKVKCKVSLHFVLESF